MLSILAAVIPSIGALLVAGDVLMEQARLRHERRVRYRISYRVEALQKRLQGDPDFKKKGFSAIRSRCEELEGLLLRLNGLPTTMPTFRDTGVSSAMSGPLLPGRETVRQWILLGSALAGLVLLAADLA